VCFPKVMILCALLVTGLAACGHKSTQSGTAGTPEPAATAVRTSGSASSGNGMAGVPGAMATTAPIAAGPMRPVPGNVTCAGGALPVWANPRSHAYHLPGDPLYGRTRHGMYMCRQTATAAGYHQAKAHHPQSQTTP
jgi:hypothetical protein